MLGRRVLPTLIIVIPFGFAVFGQVTLKQKSESGSQSHVPTTWDDAAMATLEVPLANPIGSPNDVSADYYYKIPVRPIYKSYPVYAPGHEPAGYMAWLKQQEPVVVWDDRGHKPPLETEAERIKAGETVFDAPIEFSPPLSPSVEDVHNLAWYSKAGVPTGRDGIMPFVVYVIRKKGRVEVGAASCGTCHTRLLPDGTILKGAQGNFPYERALFARPLPSAILRPILVATFGAPWIKPDPLASSESMTAEEIAAASAAIPAGIIGRQGTSLLYPAQTPDLIGVRERRYLDHTGLQQHRSIVDLMRYAALNQGADVLASYAGFIPAGTPPRFQNLPRAATQTRYSDEQLYALALYVYSLKPPLNPNKFDAEAARGKRVFEREGCATCHTPPLYTNNKLTPADGFTPPPGADKKYDILPISVATDPYLTTKTRRGTGYYKVPSLKGVWYRSMFGHNGWCATLEDWFDARRTLDNYVPTGLKPYGAKTFAVKGHPYGLAISSEDRKALIAFLKTL